MKIRLDPTWYLQTCCKLLKQYASSLWIKSLDNQLALSQLTNCSRLVIIKSEQATWTHPDIQTCCNLDVPGCVAIVINITFLYNHPLKYNLIATLTCEVIPKSPIQVMVCNNIFYKLVSSALKHSSKSCYIMTVSNLSWQSYKKSKNAIKLIRYKLKCCSKLVTTTQEHDCIIVKTQLVDSFWKELL